MEYRRYPKIFRLGKEETNGLLDCWLIIQEKVDGANVSIFWHDGRVRCGSRTRMLPEDESFNGFQEAVKANKELEQYFKEAPDNILYGEWLVKHTITYPDEAYRKIYLYDIYNPKAEPKWISQGTVELVAKRLGFEYPYIFARGKLTEDEIKEFVGKSNIAPAGEGVVLKAIDFVNKFGDHAYAKLVHQKFKESNAIVFGGNNKHSETYWEMYVVNKYCTVARVQKIMQKLQAVTDKRLGYEHIPQIAETVYRDILVEEIYEISKKVKKVNFNNLKRVCNKKAIHIYKDILDGNEDRVAYGK